MVTVDRTFDLHTDNAMAAGLRTFAMDAGNGPLERMGIGGRGPADLALAPVPYSHRHRVQGHPAHQFDRLPPDGVQVQLFVD